MKPYRRKAFFIAVGPEGGFSKDEIIKTKEAGFISVSLGKQILKSRNGSGRQ